MIEWSWVKAHSGILLNECADTLATKGVNNEPSQGLVQYLVPIGEDTDNREYEMKDGDNLSD
jgi:ribonuclease HI